MTAYYNEHDPFAAAWLRELIADNLIAPGEVDERSIEDVRPDELSGFAQCHFFAGIGIWSLALREAGWSDDEPIWTGSCPCQPFSAAGKGGGFADERHLWPAFHWLIEQCGPELVVGEQVASKDGLAWLDLVSADVEASGYAFGAVDTCAAGFGAPHIRQRLYWMADAVPAGRPEGRTIAGHRSVAGIGGTYGLENPELSARARQRPISGPHLLDEEAMRLAGRGVADGPCDADTGSRLLRRQDRRLADTDGGNAGAEGLQRSGEQRQQPQDGGAGGVADTDADRQPPRGLPIRPRRQDESPPVEQRHGEDVRLGDSGSIRRERREASAQGHDHDGPASERPQGEYGTGESSAHRLPVRPGPLNGLWRDADWLCCTDGKWRPVAPGSFPLAPAGTVRNRVGLLRGAGNAINLSQAQAFFETVIAVRGRRLELAA